MTVNKKPQWPSVFIVESCFNNPDDNDTADQNDCYEKQGKQFSQNFNYPNCAAE